MPAARIVRTGRQRPVSFIRGWARLALGWESMSDERRCLVIDAQPAVRLGVKGLLADRYEVEEAEDGQRLDHTRPDFARACGRCDVVVHGRAAADHRFARVDG